MRITSAPKLLAAAAAITLSSALPIDAADTTAVFEPGQARIAVATMMSPEGGDLGTVTLYQPIHGVGVVVDARLINMPAGAHAFHIHETGRCDAPDFKSAGGHANPTAKKHGIASPDGMHAGDLPNIHVPENGTLRVEMFAPLIRLDSSLYDADGSSIVIHAGADDYMTDPAGDAGARIACGVIIPR
jgi:superoxide dismutase, Cu-Zn family